MAWSPSASGGAEDGCKARLLPYHPAASNDPGLRPDVRRAPACPYEPPRPRVSQGGAEEDSEMQPRGCIGVCFPAPPRSLGWRGVATATPPAALGEPQEDALAQRCRRIGEEAPTSGTPSRTWSREVLIRRISRGGFAQPLVPAVACETGKLDGSAHSVASSSTAGKATKKPIWIWAKEKLILVLPLDEKEVPAAFVCCGHWTARMCCSWCFKVAVMMIILGWFFVWGPLSRPLWMPISMHRACQTCDDDVFGGCPKFFQQKVLPKGTQDDCMLLCEEAESCNAVDWFRATRYCNLYEEACLKPADASDNASSWQTGTSCRLGNGTYGILIQGRCRTGVVIPTAGHIFLEEVPRLIVSPWSWSFSFLVAFVYSWVRSEWLRKKIPLRSCLGTMRCLFCYGSFRARCVLAVAILLGLLFWRHERALPPVPKPADFLHESLKDTFGLVCGPAVAAMLVCAPLRQCIVAIVVAIGGVIMSCFSSAAALALSLCFDGATLGAEGLLASVLTGGAAASAVGDSALAVEAGVAGDAALGAEGAVAADATAVAAAAGEAAAAADAAIAADAAMAAEAAAAADSAVAIALCVVQ